MIATIIAILTLSIYAIAITILDYLNHKAYDKILDNCIDLRVELAQTLVERDDFKVTIEKQKDIIADLSRQINEATIKKVPDESPSEAKSEKPKKETKSKTTRKTTTRKTNTKKKEVKE